VVAKQSRGKRASGLPEAIVPASEPDDHYPGIARPGATNVAGIEMSPN
jgi:hypothetical protein